MAAFSENLGVFAVATGLISLESIRAVDGGSDIEAIDATVGSTQGLTCAVEELGDIFKHQGDFESIVVDGSRFVVRSPDQESSRDETFLS